MKTGQKLDSTGGEGWDEAGGAAVVLLGMGSGEVEKGSILCSARNSGIPIDH